MFRKIFFFGDISINFKRNIGSSHAEINFYFLKIKFDLNQEFITLKRSTMAELKIGNQNTKRRGFFKKKDPEHIYSRIRNTLLRY